MRDTLDAAAPGEKRKLLSQLEEAIETGNTDLTLWQCLLFMANHSRLHGVRTVYKNIYGLFLWGYPLKASLVNGLNPSRPSCVSRSPPSNIFVKTTRRAA